MVIVFAVAAVVVAAAAVTAARATVVADAAVAAASVAGAPAPVATPACQKKNLLSTFLPLFFGIAANLVTWLTMCIRKCFAMIS